MKTLQMILLTLGIFLSSWVLASHKPKIILTIQENVRELIIVNLPFTGVKVTPDLIAMKVSLIDQTATNGHDYVLQGIGMAYDNKTDQGLIMLEFKIIDDMESEDAETFLILLDLGEIQLGGIIQILDDDTI